MVLRSPRCAGPVCASYGLRELISESSGRGPRYMRVPACAKCRSVELLIPSVADGPRGPDDGSYGHLHQLLVDVLWSRLAGEDEPERAQWLRDGLTLPAA